MGFERKGAPTGWDEAVASFKASWTKPRGVIGWIAVMFTLGLRGLDMIGRYQTAEAFHWDEAWSWFQSTGLWKMVVYCAALAVTPAGTLAIGIGGLFLIFSASSRPHTARLRTADCDDSTPLLPGFEDDEATFQAEADEYELRRDPLRPRATDTATRAEFRRRIAQLCLDFKTFEEERNRNFPRAPVGESADKSLHRRVAYENDTAQIALDRFRARFEVIHGDLVALGIDDAKLHRAIAEHAWPMAALLLPRLLDRIP